MNWDRMKVGIGRTVVIGLCLAAIAGCGSPGAMASPEASLATGAQPSSSADPECYGIDESVDRLPYRIENLLQYADRVVVAEVTAREPGEFNTADRKRPTKPRGPTYNPMVFTPYSLQVAQTLLGDASLGHVRAVTEGGEADCIVHNVSPGIVLERDKTYAFFLQPSPDADGNRHADPPLILAAWPIDADGNVQTELDGALSLEQLSRAVAAAVR